jgi:formate dehydrogenase gamma subunit
MSQEPLDMTNSAPNPTIETQPVSTETSPEANLARAKNYRRTITLAKMVRYLPGGERVFVRFHQEEILEHWILLVNFGILSVTGLLEMFVNNRFSADFLTPVFRNMDYVRGLHNVAAVFYVAMMAIHALVALGRWFVKRETPLLAPSRQDWLDFLRHWRYLLGRNYPRPEYGRFTIDQKVTYWMVASFSTLMLITAFVMWFQTLIVQVVPDAILPIARSIHSLMGLLIFITFLPWHIYHTVVKEQNSSIFSGVLDEKTIRRNHPLDYRQILEAAATIQNLPPRQSPAENQPPVEEEQASHEEQKSS